MRIVMFYHSLLSDWNHGNAHFLRGIVSELVARGHEVRVYEPENAWSLKNLRAEHGQKPIRKFRAAYPGLKSIAYDVETLDLDKALDRADLVIVHEWNNHQLVRRLGEFRRRTPSCRLLFHDTHHRMVTDPESMASYDLTEYDGVLAYGRVLQNLYENQGRVRRVWTWHEGADTRIFFPQDKDQPDEGDLVWIGNWGDDERSAELEAFLVRPSRALGLRTQVHGVRYPLEARHTLAAAHIGYGGWLPNFEVPRVFARYRMTVHIPRRPYIQALPGIPTIRVFEALACGIPLVCALWQDTENLFHADQDFLSARNEKEMTARLHDLLHDRQLGRTLARNGLKTILSRHTCVHRVDELLKIHASLLPPAARP